MDEIDRIKEKCIERVLDCRYEDDKVGIYIERAIQDATQHEKQRTKEACKEKAMEWWDEQIKTHNQPNLYIMSKNSLKKAIDEAKVDRHED